MKKIVGIVICILMAISTLSIGVAQNVTQVAVSNPEPSAAKGEVFVTIYNKGYHPDVVIVDLNWTVTWTNLEMLPHTIVSDQEGLFRSEPLAQGETFSYKFEKKGNYGYHDGANLNMTGRVVAWPGGNRAPTTPIVHGPANLNLTKGVTYEFTAVAYDYEGLEISYYFDWGDKTNSGWTPYVASGTLVNASHIYTKRGTFTVKVQAKDFYANATSDWGTLPIKVPTSFTFTYPSLLQQLLERFFHLFPILEQFLVK